MKRIVNIDLDMRYTDYLNKFEVKQLDDIVLKINMFNDNESMDITDQTIELFVGGNNEAHSQTENITTNGNQINIDLDRNLIGKTGQALAEVRFTSSEGTSTSTTFLFAIVESIGEGATIPGNIEGFVEKYNRLIRELQEYSESSISDVRNQSNASIKEIEKNAKKANDEVKTTFDTVSTELNTLTQEKISEVTTNATQNINNAKNEFSTMTTNLETKTNESIERVETVATTTMNDTNTNATNSINQVKTESTKAIQDIKKEFTALTTQQQKELELLEARDGEESLKLRLERDVKKGKLIEETKQGEYITFDDTVKAPINSIELHGNTVQDPVNLDIQSSGIDNGDGTFTYTVVACGKNILNNEFKLGNIGAGDGNEIASSVAMVTKNFSRVGSGIYTISINGDRDFFNWFCYDADFKYIGAFTARNPEFSKEKPGTVWVKCSKSVTTLDAKVQLELGDSATSYEEYQENRIDIKLPFKIKNVKGGKDILYYDALENAWCILRKIAYLNYSELTNVGIASTLSNCIQIHGTSNKEIKSYDSTGSSLITSKPFKHSFDDDEHMWIDSNTWKYKASIPKTIASTLDEVKTYLAKGDLFMLFWDKNPEKIILPPSEQTKLNSLNGKTNIWVVSGVVSATVKATVSKSLASAMQANTNEITNLQKEIKNINGLRETQDFQYDTDKSYQICTDTQNGVVKDLKVCGETRINLLSNSKMKFITSTTGWSNIVVEDAPMLHQGKTYTLIPRTNTNKTGINGYLCELNYEDGTRERVYDGTNLERCELRVFTPKKNVSRIASSLRHNTESYSVEFECIILEGDCTKNPPPYFEGMASIGNGTPLEVNTLKWSGNLFDDRVLNPFITSQSDSEYTLDYGKIWYERAKLVDLPFKENTSYKFMCTQKCSNATSKPRFYLHYTDGTEDQVTVGNVEWETVTSISRPNKTLEYISVTYGNSGGIWTVKKDSICLYEDTTKYKFEPYLEDKKPILYKDANGAWNPVTELNEWDVLDTPNNKLELNSLRTMLNNKDKLWRDNGTDKGGFKTYWRDYGNCVIDKCICNKLKVYDVAVVREEKCIFFNKTKGLLYITIPQSECASLTDLDTWFSNNNIEVVIPTPKKEYELNPIYPDSYEGDTMVMIQGGTLPIKASWKITGSLPNMVMNISKRQSRIENEMFNYFTTMFKNMFNGNLDQVAFMLYPEEFIKHMPSTLEEPIV